MVSPPVIPPYIKITVIIVGVLASCYLLVLGEMVIVPLLYATLFAILLNPAVTFLTGKKVNRLVAISIAMTVALGLLALLSWLMVSQLQIFSSSFPQFSEKLFLLLHNSIDWLAEHLSLSTQQINGWLGNLRNQAMENSGSYLTQTFSLIGVFIAVLVIIPVYIFMLLYYQPLLMDFIRQLFSKQYHASVVDVIIKVRGAVQAYLRGLMIEAIIVAVMNSVALLLLGVEYAVLLGIIGAVLNVIPYLGGISAVALPMIVALVNQDPLHMLFVMGAYGVIQFIDNHYLIPKVVAGKVQVNALISVIGVIIGGAVWGFAGMFLSIPLLAVIKIICDHVEGLKPYSYLLGDTMPPPAVVDTFLHTKPKPKDQKHAA